ncbi:MAG TPA: hypothetical protein VHW03_03570 [Chthoniobacterales bacterium]|nr:hypothetical protein [Chthoniobacterales bacterium]
MMPIANARKISGKPEPPSAGDRERTIINIRRLIWLYLILLIFEGAFRKWVLPQFSAPLLIIRDPVAIAIYVLAVRARVFPFNFYTVSIVVLAILSWAAGILVLSPYVAIKTVLLITAYGVRCDFLHLPLIFVIPAVMDMEDVKRIGWWTLVGMIPMGILMAIQFNSSPESFINTAAGLGEGMQIGAGGGRIRPPGTFSFISGAVYYLSAVAAFFLHAVLAKIPYQKWLLGLVGASLLVGMGVSGSRSAVLAVGVVVASLALVLLVRPTLVGKVGRYILLAALVLWAISYLPVFREGIDILSDRFEEAAEDSNSSVVGGLFTRTAGGFIEGLESLPRAPLGGFGLGVGTNGGANFLVGHAEFLLAENEWSRILEESGPILGLAFLLWRCAVTFRIGRLAVRQLTFGNVLPLFLFSAGIFDLLEGPFGQPTSLGFAVVFAGLSLAARDRENDQVEPPEEAEEPEKKPQLVGRSVYAERLHGSRGGSHRSHGSFDR